MIILNILELIIFMLVLPAGAGLFLIHFFNKKSVYDINGITPARTLIYGYMVMLALLELIGIPCVLLFIQNAYTIFVLAFGILFGFISIIGIGLACKDKRLFGKDGLTRGKFIKSKAASFKALSIEGKIYMVLIFALLLFQLFMVLRLASYDVDDFIYNSAALSAQKLKTMYRTDANTGRSTFLDIRHGLALFPMWQAFLSTLTGIHVVIVAHRIVPLLLIPLSYLLLYEIAIKLFPGKIELRLIFLLLMNVWRIFGHVSYYTSETFFYTRTWQGKSLAGNFLFPAIIWIFLRLYDNEKKENKAFLYTLLTLTILSCGAGSSLAVLLGIMLTVLLGAMFAIRERNAKCALAPLLCSVPGLIYIFIYIVS